MNLKQAIGWYAMGVLAVSLTAGEATYHFGGSIKDGKTLRISASTLAKAERRSENLLKTKFQRAMDNYRLDSVNCENLRIDLFLRSLRQQVKAGGGPNVNLLLRASPKQRAVPISMDLQDIPVSEVLRYAAETAGLECIIEEHAVVIEPKAPKTKE